MTRLEKEYLDTVLTDLNLAELPPKWDGTSIWALAIIKVMKSDMQTHYVIAQNKIGDDMPIIKKVYGSVAPIRKLIEIYPILILPNDKIYTASKKADMIKLLKDYCSTPVDESQLESMTREDLQILLANISIEDHIRNTMFFERKYFGF